MVQRVKRDKQTTARATRCAKHAEWFPDFEVRRATRLSLGANQKIFAILQWLVLVARAERERFFLRVAMASALFSREA